ncbi:solute carrier organic anion transporter family member 1A4-like isoform X2 [Amphiura filiformis]|uniref:solute carrier organic anion transporter family member 1A4-like isoform X2 n=1 Tax=Amphiura filiformis TaxID=82378 RepID=UPI003B2173BF
MAGSSVQWQKLSEEGGPDPIILKRTDPNIPRNGRTSDPEAEETNCGLFGWRPACLQRFATPNTFFGLVCACLMLEVAAHTGYVGGVLSTIEKDFQLKSSEVAFITVINHIGAFTAVVTSYIGNKTHRPRCIALGVGIIGMGQFICALPHFFTDSNMPTTTTDTNSSTLVCGATLSVVNLQNSTECVLENKKGSILSKALLLIIGELITGIGSGPVIPLLITYIDDCVGKVKVSVYVGVLFACAATGPVFGYLLSALTLSYHVNFDRNINAVDITPSDPGWVGAWWLGFFILGPLMMLMAPVLCLFPREMIHHRSPDACAEVPSYADGTSNESPSKIGNVTRLDQRICQAILGYLNALKRIGTNLPFISITLSTTGLVIAGLGQFYFGAKYLETQFALTTWTASLILAAMCLPGTLFGILLGGFLVKKWKLTTPPQKSAMMSGTMGLVSCLLLPILFSLGCTNSNFAGLTKSYPVETLTGVPIHRKPLFRHRGEYNLVNECNSRCQCSERIFNPVCGNDGITFVSPCFAGCDTAINDTVFSNCSCIPTSHEDNGDIIYGSTTLGQCLEMCVTVIPYALIYAIAGFCMALSQNPNYMVTLRSVEPQDRAIGLGMNAVVMRLLGNLLGPMYFGAAIDAACLLHETNDCGKSGACFLYNLRKYRYIFVGLLFVFVFVHTCFVWLAYYSLKKQQGLRLRQHVPLEEQNDTDTHDVTANSTTAFEILI